MYCHIKIKYFFNALILIFVQVNGNILVFSGRHWNFQTHAYYFISHIFFIVFNDQKMFPK